MAFSAALALTDLNDFLGPSQECIKPVEYIEEPVQEKEPGAAATEIRIDHSSNAYYEVSAAAAGPSNADGSAGGKKLKKAEISLNDCLACSGCVTSAESVLVQMQSHEEVYRYLADHPNVTPILSLSPQSVASLAALHRISPASCLRRLRKAFKDILGFKLVFDTTFARHLSLLEGQREFYEKSATYRAKGKGRDVSIIGSDPTLASSSSATHTPLLASACPGWICYAEKTHGELLPFISAVKSPQQIMGVLMKDWLPKRMGLSRGDVYHVSVMPCYDKKLEASRPDFQDASGNRDVDCVLTTGEVLKILHEKGVSLADMEEDSDTTVEDDYLPTSIQHPGSASGGYLHNAITAAVNAHSSGELEKLSLDTRLVRGQDYVEYILRLEGRPVFRGAKCYGFRNLQNVVRKIGRETGVTVTKGAAGKALSAQRGGGMLRRGARGVNSGTSTASGTPEEPERNFDFIEVMACPSGCVNGGGQIAPPKHPQPIKVDREGMRMVEQEESEVKLVADEKDGHRVLSGPDWVARVEEFYWRFGAQKIPLAEAMGVHESLRDYVQLSPQYPTYDKMAQTITTELACTPSQVQGPSNPFRTQYRAVVSKEVNGLAVKW